MGLLKAKYSDEADLPETIDIKELYEERDGEFVLKRGAIEGVQTDANVKRIEETMRKERDRRKALEKTLRGLDVLDKEGELDSEKLDSIREMVDEYDDLKERAEAAGGKIDDEKIRELAERQAKRETAKLERELKKERERAQELEEQNGKLSGTIRDAKIESALRSAAEGKVRPEAMGDALMYKGFFDVDDDGKVITREGSIEPDVWLTEQLEKKPHWSLPSQGGGARGNDGRGANGASGNPWALNSFSKAEQARIARENPSKAEQYWRQAGFKDQASAYAADIEDHPDYKAK